MSHATRIKRDQRRERRARVRALLQPRLPAPLLSVWQDACYVWSTFCWLFETPAQLARREALSRAEHRQRQRRLRLAWPDRPASWRARFCMMPRRRDADAERPVRGAPRDIRVVASFPLARRLEAVRRILANPDARIRRFAFTLARIAQQNARANCAAHVHAARLGQDCKKSETGPPHARSIHAGAASTRGQRGRSLERGRRPRLATARKSKAAPCRIISCGNAASCLLV